MLGDTEVNVATTDLESEYEILGELGRGADRGRLSRARS